MTTDLFSLAANIFSLRIKAADARESGKQDQASDYERQVQEAQEQFDYVCNEGNN